MEKKKQQIALTGDRPTGPLHLGHYVGSLKNRILLQNTCNQYVMIADTQALTDHAENPTLVRNSVYEVLCDYLASGLDPEKTTMFVQSALPQLPELAMYFLNLVTWNRLKHNPTVKNEIVQKGFGESVPAGFMTYPIFQAADILAFGTDIVPVGEDQQPMIEQTNEIARAFNRVYKTDVLKEVKSFIPAIGRLPGTDGSVKMGKTLNNAIFLKDDIATVTKKIKKMVSDPNHTDINQPGLVEGNPVFTYLDAFCDDTAYVESLKDHYLRGGLGDGILKGKLLDVMVAFLEPIQKSRAEFASDKVYLNSILTKGIYAARLQAEETLSKVKKAMNIDW